MKRTSLLPALAAALLCAGLPLRTARAVEYNFAGSVSLNYKALVNELDTPRTERNLVFSGFNINAAVKAVVDVTSNLSGTVKMCYGCHGFEALNLFVELTPHPAFNVRAGRFMPAFGDFYLRHDPTVHKTADNPLPYDMGHMIHLGEWGMGVLPIPYVDNGVEFYGTLRPGHGFSIAYTAHVVNGWKGPAQPAKETAANAVPVHDFNFRRMRFAPTTDYLVDNNRIPSVGGRLALTFARTVSMNPLVPDITVGGSGMYGTYDDYDKLAYWIVGVDFYMHLWRINLRCELIRRQQEVDPRRLDYEPKVTTGLTLPMNWSDKVEVVKDGFYAETDFPLGGYLEGVLRFDGMHRSGPREAQKDPSVPTYAGPPSSTLDFDDWILRYTAGLNIIPVTGAKLKLDYEYWTFKNFPDEHEVHLALVASF